MLRNLIKCNKSISYFSIFSNHRFHSSDTTKYTLNSFKGVNNNIGFIEINHPKVHNALCTQLINELVYILKEYDQNESVKSIIITGNKKVFAAGADIKEMCGRHYSEIYKSNFLSLLDQVALVRKPIIAAVSGFALGGGCELAMLCDIIYAAENAKFGQPEIKLGTIPGAGGTQRLIRAVGKSRAMELILTGDQFSSREAEAAGLVSRVFPNDQLIPKSIELGEKIGELSGLAVRAAKEAVNAANNMSLNDGLQFERRLFQATFATNDCKEGMTAFVEKRKPVFTET